MLFIYCNKNDQTRQYLITMIIICQSRDQHLLMQFKSVNKCKTPIKGKIWKNVNVLLFLLFVFYYFNVFFSPRCSHIHAHNNQTCLNKWNVFFTVWQLRRTISKSGEHLHIHYLFLHRAWQCGCHFPDMIVIWNGVIWKSSVK